MTTTSPGWYTDPSRTHELRFYDGTMWTELVIDDGVAAVHTPAATEPPAASRAPKAIGPGVDTLGGTDLHWGGSAEAGVYTPAPALPPMAVPVPPAFRTPVATGSRPSTRALQSPPTPVPPETPRPFPGPARADPPPLSPSVPSTRRWQTWHLATVAAVALLVGLVVGRVTTSGSRAPAKAKAPVTAGTTPAVLGGAAPLASTTTTVAVAAGGKTLSAKGVGDSTSEKFSFPGTWQLTWSYTCSKGSAPFTLGVDDSDGFAIGHGVSSTGGSGNGVLHYPGGNNLIVKIITSCTWSVKLNS